MESVINPGNVPDFGKVMDIEMLALPGGRERTKEDFQAIFTRAGFDLNAILPTNSSVCVIEALRP